MQEQRAFDALYGNARPDPSVFSESQHICVDGAACQTKSESWPICIRGASLHGTYVETRKKFRCEELRNTLAIFIRHQEDVHRYLVN